MAESVWSQAQNQALAGLTAALQPVVQQTVAGAIYTVTGNLTLAGELSPAFAQGMVSQFAPQYTQASSAAMLALISYRSSEAGAMTVGILTWSIGLVIWTAAYYEKRRARAGLMMLASLFGVIFNSMVFYMVTHLTTINEVTYTVLTGFGAAMVILLLNASLHSATFFWSSERKRICFLTFMYLTLWAIAILFTVYVAYDAPGCGFHQCTARTKWTLAGIPSAYVLTFFCFWLRSLWRAQSDAIGSNKGSIRNVHLCT